MKITVFTSNQPRHIALVGALVNADHHVYAVIEPKPMVLPYMGGYWDRVRKAERQVFPLDTFSGGYAGENLELYVIRPGELSQIDLPADAKRADRFVVFSSSYIKGELIDFLVERNALNLHIGIAPEFRGSAPNFWAEYLGRPDLVGAQVQRLAKGLDSGEILAEVRPSRLHCLPKADPFLRGMEACRLGIEQMVLAVEYPNAVPIRPNDRSQEIAYRRHDDFTEEVVAAYLRRLDEAAK